MQIFTIREVPRWAQPFMTYLADGELPADEVSAWQVKRWAHAYTIINKELYKRNVSGIY